MWLKYVFNQDKVLAGGSNRRWCFFKANSYMCDVTNKKDIDRFIRLPSRAVEIAYEKLGISFDSAGVQIEVRKVAESPTVSSAPRAVTIAEVVPAPKAQSAPKKRMGRPKGSKNKR